MTYSTLADTEADLAVSIAEGDKRSTKELKAEVADLETIIKIETGEISLLAA